MSIRARVDFAVSPPGLIFGAMCHTLILDDEGLAIIKVSRGWRVGYSPNGALNKMAANATIRHLQGKAASATETVSEANYRQLASAKGSTFIARAELTDVKWDAKFLDLRLRGGGKKYRFNFEGDLSESANAFAAALGVR